MKGILEKQLLLATYTGGVQALTALEDDLKEVSNKVDGEIVLSLPEFLGLVSDFKDTYRKLLDS